MLCYIKHILHKEHINRSTLTVAGQNAINLQLSLKKTYCSLTVNHSVTANEFLTRML